MEAIEVKKRAEADGIQFILDGGKLKARGSHEVVNKWLPVIKKHKADLMTVLSVRLWTQGNPYECISCGRATGWTTSGQPLCPACVPPADPEGYRREMLAWADELESYAQGIDDADRQEAQMAVVKAIRVEFTGAE
jgi:hypothetical protein